MLALTVAQKMVMLSSQQILSFKYYATHLQRYG
jgi:hypothetical protein